MRTKNLGCIVIILLPFFTNAQDYKKVRIGFGLSYLADKPGLDAAVSWEAAYRIKDNILIGFRGESAASAGVSINSRSLFYQRYFGGTKSFRPFVGIGAGLYSPRMSMVGGCGDPYSRSHSASEETKFGFYPRVGFDLRHFSMTLDWNIANSSRAIVSNDMLPTDQGYNPPHTEYLTNNYLSLRLGFFLGGGRKKSKL